MILGVSLDSVSDLALPVLQTESWQTESLEIFEHVKFPCSSNLEIPFLRARCESCSNYFLRQSFSGYWTLNGDPGRLENARKYTLSHNVDDMLEDALVSCLLSLSLSLLI